MAGIKYASSRKALLPAVALLLLGMVSMAVSVSADEARTAADRARAVAKGPKVPPNQAGSTGKPLWTTIPNNCAGGKAINRCRALFGAYCATCSPGFKSCVACMDPSLTNGVEIEMANGACTRAKAITVNFDDLTTYSDGYAFLPKDQAYTGLFWASSYMIGGSAYPSDPWVWNPAAAGTWPNATASAPNGLRGWLGDYLQFTAPEGKTFSLISLFATERDNPTGKSVQVTGFNATGAQVAQVEVSLLSDQATPVTLDEQVFSDLSKVTVAIKSNSGDDRVFIDNVVIRPTLV